MMRKMILVGCVLGLILTVPSVYASQEKSIDVKPGQRLVVDLKVGGKIHVTAWKKASVRVVVTDKKGNVKELPVLVKRTDEGVEVKTQLGPDFKSWSRHSGDHVVMVQVPEKFDLKLRSMGGGIYIKGVSGEISGRTMGGDLELLELDGVVYMKTMGGDVTLRDSHVDGEVKTMGGRVLLEDVVGDVKGSSMGGNVIYRNVKKKSGGKGIDKVVRISTMGGTVNVDDAPKGADLHTMGGQITVKSAGEFAKVKTMGGDIILKAVDGWIKAKTLGGDVKARMVGDPAKGDRHVEITSLGGDIELTVPAKLSMDVEIRLTIYRNGHNEYRIRDDFNLKVEADKEWLKRDGKEIKVIRATGRTGDGRNKVVLHTTNGNITLRKAGK